MKYKLLKNRKVIISMLPAVAFIPVSINTLSNTNKSSSLEQCVRPDVTITLEGRGEDLFKESADCHGIELIILETIKGDPDFYRIPSGAQISLSKIGVVCDGILYNVSTNCYLNDGYVVNKKEHFSVYVNGFQDNPRYATVYDLLNKEIKVNEQSKSFTEQWYFYLIIALGSATLLTVMIIFITKFAKKKSSEKEAKLRAFGLTKTDSKKCIESNVIKTPKFKKED